MRENMLLQYADDIIKVEIGSLRGEMLRLVELKVKRNGLFKELLHSLDPTTAFFYIILKISEMIISVF